MNIQNAIGKFANEARAEQPHETRQADQIHVVLVQFGDEHAVVHLAIQTFGWQADRGQPSRERRFQPARLRPVRDDHRNLHAEHAQRAARHARRNRLEVRAAPRDQDAQPLHRYSTRGLPRCTATTLPMRNGVSTPSTPSAPLAMLAAIASKFEQRPEIRMPSRFTGTPRAACRAAQPPRFPCGTASRPAYSARFPPLPCPARAPPVSFPRPDSRCGGSRLPECRQSAAALQKAEGSSTPPSRSTPRTPWAACAVYCR